MLLASTLTMFSAAPGAAQRGSAIAINPIAAIRGDLVGEIETATRPRLTFGAAWNRTRSNSANESGTEHNERLWASVDVVARYYRRGRTPGGFSFGVTAGRAWTTRTRALDFGRGRSVDTSSAAEWTLGGRTDYNRTFRRRIHAGIGADAKAGLLHRGSSIAQMPRLLPSLRGVVGLRF